MSKKKKIVLHSNHCRVKTGFGKHMKHLLSYLHKTGKYEIVEFANGKNWYDPSLKNLPWKAYGSLPFESDLIQEIKGNKPNERKASYGQYKIDDLIKQEKPDIYLGIEDVWGLEGFWNKKWWKKINSIIWTPVDSLPLLDKHLEAANNTSNIIVQASFAEKALKESGLNNTHLMPVPIDTSNFKKLKNKERDDLRLKYGIDKEDFIIGFVFRNQLRKSVPNLLDGFKFFLEDNPDSKAKLLLHTHWNEGWDIPRLLREKNIKPETILTTYYCNKCKQYEIKPFSGQGLDCKFCGSKKSQETTQINRGISEEQLNEVYNLMDVYCHPFTSGGQEIPIQEAKLTELITLVTDYSCGIDYCSKKSGGIPLMWSEYREPGTQFIKASTLPEDIFSKLKLVYNMPKKKREDMGKVARDFVIDFCSIESVCSKFEKLIDSMDKTSWDFDFSYVPKNIHYVPPNIEKDRDWVIDLYKNILMVEDDYLDQKGINHWIHRLSTDLNRQEVYNFFIKTAHKENLENQKKPFAELLSEDDEGRRILFVLPENEIDVFNSTSLLQNLKDKYPNHNIYYATSNQYFDILLGNNLIHKIIEYNQAMENFIWSEGQGSYSGMFEFVLMPHTNTHRITNYVHGNKHKIEYDLNYAQT